MRLGDGRRIRPIMSSISGTRVAGRLIIHHGRCRFSEVRPQSDSIGCRLGTFVVIGSVCWGCAARRAARGSVTALWPCATQRCALDARRARAFTRILARIGVSVRGGDQLVSGFWPEGQWSGFDYALDGAGTADGLTLRLGSLQFPACGTPHRSVGWSGAGFQRGAAGAGTFRPADLWLCRRLVRRSSKD
jgi:hypothetical protein